MKLKVIIFIACWSFLSLLHGQGKKMAVFNDFGQPGSISIGNGYIYINEKTTVFIYNLEGYKLVNKFGKEGEGPGELKLTPFGGPMGVVPHKNKVYISSFGKLSIFSKTGEYLKEHKVTPFDNYLPFGEKYLCISPAPKEENSPAIVLALFLADENLNKGRLIYKSDFEVGQNVKFDFPITPIYPGVDKDKLFVIAGIHGLAIDAFNQKGEKLYSIKRDLQKLKIPSSYKDKTLEWFKKSPTYKQFYEYFKSHITFKDYYPPIYRINVDNGKIYVMTNKMKEEQRECIVMDLKGKEIKSVYLPVPEQYGLDVNSYFTISDNYFYILVENIDEENWELYRLEI